MTQSKNTKKALLASMLSLLLCVAMLIGSTFAWFTDSVTSGRNRIVAGNLDVELEYAKAAAAEDGTIDDIEWNTVTGTTNDLFGSDLWEPGHTEYVYLRVRNNGSLALKYSLAANVYGTAAGGDENTYTNIEGGTFQLSKYLVFNVIDNTNKVENRESLWISDSVKEKDAMGKLDGIGTTGAVLYPKETAGKISETAFTLAVYMPTSVGNEANWDGKGDAPEIYFGFDLLASQFTYESDSFNELYDDSATDKNGHEIAISTSSSTPAAGAPTEFYFSGNAPAEAKSTTVEFVPDSLEAGREVELVLESGNVPAAESKPDASGNAPVSYLDLTLLVNGVETAYNEPAKPITISTYVEPGMNGLHVYYEQEDGSVDTGTDYKESYDPKTGLLVIKTTHLSKYVVYKQLKTVTLKDAKTLRGDESSTFDDSRTMYAGTSSNHDKKREVIRFCVYDEDLIKKECNKTWGSGNKIDEAGNGDAQMFVSTDAKKVYICVQPDVDLIYLNPSCYTLFDGFDNLKTIDFGNGLVSTAKVTNMSYMFWNCSVSDMDDLSWFDTSNVTTMANMFTAGNITSLDVSNWDTSKVTRMDNMLHCSGLTELKGLNKLNTSSVTRMDLMFAVHKLKTLDVTGWDVSKVKDMHQMFYWCGSSSILTEIKGLETWNTESVTNMSDMFRSCQKLVLSDELADWNTSNVTNMADMFHDCYAIAELDLSGWNTSKVTNMSNMFNHMSYRVPLERIYVGEGWSTESVTNGTGMFGSLSSKFVGGAGTVWSSAHTDHTYAHIDGGDTNPGYFTSK